MKDLKHKALRGGVTRIVVQGTNLAFRMISVVVLARLLDPNDFGLVGMVTAVTGVFSLFMDFGLSTATIQSPTITNQQISVLFWLNFLIGVVLTGLTLAMAPVLADFYHEPRLFWLTAALAPAFLFHCAAIQHTAVLEREMRFGSLGLISVLSQMFGVAAGVGLAIYGLGYWALAAMTVVPTLVTVVGVWLAAGWLPGKPQRSAGVGSMLRFGGTVTLSSMVVYAGQNLEKVLLGLFWGAQSLGLYGRAYTLNSMPMDVLRSAISVVAFAVLSRVQGDADRFRRYFLKYFTVYSSASVPVGIACGLFADDIILVMLGPNWGEAAVIFAVLAPTILVRGLIAPVDQLMMAMGLTKRTLRMALIFAPLSISGYIIGLPYGPSGVATAYTAIMVAWVLPGLVWSVRGTYISLKDLLTASARPLFSGLVAMAAGYDFTMGAERLIDWINADYGDSAWGGFLYHFWHAALPRLILETTVLFAVYGVMLMFVFGQKANYLDLWRDLRNPSRV